MIYDCGYRQRDYSFFHGCDVEVKPPNGPYHYTNPDSLSTLLIATSSWPQKTKVPTGHRMNCDYVDRLWTNNQQWKKAVAELGKGPLHQAVTEANDDTLIKMASILYPHLKITAVRWVYYYNEATGYDCPRIDIIYKKSRKKTK